MRRRWLTKTKLVRALRQVRGCLKPKRHAEAMLIVGHRLACIQAHPPTWADELAATQRWFPRVEPGGKKKRKMFSLVGGKWNGTGLMKGKNGRKRDPTPPDKPVIRIDPPMKKKRGLPKPGHKHLKTKPWSADHRHQ